MRHRNHNSQLDQTEVNDAMDGKFTVTELKAL